jgi:hypothetical protein
MYMYVCVPLDYSKKRARKWAIKFADLPLKPRHVLYRVYSYYALLTQSETTDKHYGA